MTDDDHAPFAHVLHATMRAELARRPTLARGRAYFAEGRVARVVRARSGIRGDVRGSGSEVYLVGLWVKAGAIAFSCTCPVGQDGELCKHTVALALAWLTEAGTPF